MAADLPPEVPVLEHAVTADASVTADAGVAKAEACLHLDIAHETALVLGT